ncbi:ECF RNA polymerase sigma-E factor [Stieleria maiorica]|uniref:ECF RNA polymerase sigma-E factor n=1 Tax=Stieleria maiorica TaxID=2795974 RepID=A0A5B9M904_9BACT|nr:sigma-70 family RNA polymerase sigma factor [Stieleria maiorica]QEF97143.1 ECF RNA polymerase sigma-E factor [Stieleria maiorica]
MSNLITSEANQLLAGAQNGQGDCLGRLLQLYLNYLKLIARTQLDQKLQARTSASDVVQDTLLEAHRDFSKFRGSCPEEFLAWLRKILVNNLGHIIQRHVLAEKRDIRREISLDDVGATLERSTARLVAIIADPGLTPSTDAQNHEASLLLADELAELPDDYREVILLRHIEGLAFPEVAARMERSAGAVRMLWMRAIAQLRVRLESRGVL